MEPDARQLPHGNVDAMGLLDECALIYINSTAC
jgi:hypothetical protein